MFVIPAIDLKGGKVVRLSQGRFHEQTIYSENPTNIAREWKAAGAQLLHVVDLDGAEQGHFKNIPLIADIIKNISLPVQMGGGIRAKEDIEQLFSIGIERVVLGTKAVEDKDFLKEALDEWGERIAVSIDCSRGIVTKSGWTALSNVKGIDFAIDLQDLGVSTLIYTDIARDGTLVGPNVAAIKELLKKISVLVIASGGISNMEDVVKLKELESEGLWGMIIGKALYERRIDLKDAINLCSPKE